MKGKKKQVNFDLNSLEDFYLFLNLNEFASSRSALNQYTQLNDDHLTNLTTQILT